MADYKAVFSKPRRIASAISSYFARSSSGTDRATSGTYSTVSSGTPAFDRKDGLILEAASTQLLYNTGFTGAASGSPGTTPTGWTQFQTGGSTTVSAIDLGNSITYTTTAARLFNRQTVSVSANTTYVMSSVVSAVSGSVTYIEALQLFGAPSGASVTYRHNGVAVTSTDVIAASGVLEVVLTVAGTAGTVDVRMGLGAGVSITGSITHAYPQFEAGSFRTSYIYNTNTAATLTRAASYLGPIPVGDMGIASQTNEYSGQIVFRVPAAGGASREIQWPRVMSIGATAASDRIELAYSANLQRFYLTRLNAGSVVAEVSTTAGEIDLVAGDRVNLRFSWGATNGLILVSQKVGGTAYIDTNTGAAHKAAAPNPMTHIAVAANIASGSAALAHGSPYIIAEGFRVWDTALSQAQLEALTTADLDGTTYLTAWSTELGSDPPGTTPISDENITSGSLDWWRFGESGNTSENTKSGASYLGSSANINTPAFGQYAGSNQYQAPLVVYTDGTSPSSGSSRSYSSTGVAAAGRSNVVTSSGKPLWIHILAGGYDGVHQHVLTTSDSSSPVHTRTNTTGAGNVKFWETIVYWGGGNGTTLTIASTAVSGSVGLQLAAITVFPVDPTITSLGATAIDPGTDLTINHLGFASAPTSVTYAGVTEAFTGSTSTTQSVMTGIPIGDFAPSQSHVATRMRANYSLTLSDGYESASYTVQVDPMVAATAYEDWSTKDATNWYGPTVPATWQTGDEIYGYYLTGYGQVEAGTGWFSPDPLGLPAQGRLICYDISAGQWLAGVNTDLYTAPSTGAVEGLVMAVVRPIVKSVVEVIT